VENREPSAVTDVCANVPLESVTVEHAPVGYVGQALTYQLRLVCMLYKWYGGCFLITSTFSGIEMGFPDCKPCVGPVQQTPNVFQEVF